MAFIPIVVRSGPENNPISIEKFNNKVNKINDNLDKSLDNINQIPYGRNYKEEIERIKKHMQTDISDIENVIAFKYVRQVIQRHIANKDDISKKLRKDVYHYIWSLGSIFSISMDLHNAKMNIDIGFHSYLNDNIIILDLENNTYKYTGLVDLIEKELNVNFNYLEDHIFVSIDDMPRCIRKELYEVKKEQSQAIIQIREKEKKKEDRKKIRQKKIEGIFSIFKRK